MIQANELRIGSIVNYLIKDNLDDRKEWYEPTAMTWEDLKLCVEKNDKFNKFHTPIPLTKEIFLKCKGAEIVEDGIRIKIDENGNAFYLVDGFIQWSKYGAPIKNYLHINSLHQFQNLFKLHTNIDLEVSL